MIWRIDMKLWRSTAIVLNESIVVGADVTIIAVYDDDDINGFDGVHDMFGLPSPRGMLGSTGLVRDAELFP